MLKATQQYQQMLLCILNGELSVDSNSRMSVGQSSPFFSYFSHEHQRHEREQFLRQDVKNRIRITPQLFCSRWLVVAASTPAIKQTSVPAVFSSVHVNRPDRQHRYLCRTTSLALSGMPQQEQLFTASFCTQRQNTIYVWSKEAAFVLPSESRSGKMALTVVEYSQNQWMVLEVADDSDRRWLWIHESFYPIFARCMWRNVHDIANRLILREKTSQNAKFRKDVFTEQKPSTFLSVLPQKI